jgi:hypothetical protein
MSLSPPVITDGTVTLTFGPAGQYYGYCTRADVTYEFTNIASYASVTPNAVAQEITYAAIELQKMIEHYYVMPYVGSDFDILTTLREMNAKLAVARLVERFFMGNEPDLSPWAAERRSYVELLVVDIDNGLMRWEYPFGDAVAQPMLATYDLSKGATVYPNPSAADTDAQTPIFTIGRADFRKNLM